MLAHSPAQRVPHDRGTSNRESYLSSYRALAACTREFARLAEDVVHGVAALRADGVEEKPDVRLTPGRCIVQLGPVAVTLTWLRSTLDTAADGELLVIVWRGTVAPHPSVVPERREQAGALQPATALWEEVFAAAAASEAGWSWRPTDADIGGYSSVELAARAVERLRLAYLDAHAA